MRLSVSRLRGDESGYTMIAVIGAMALVSILVAGALAATNGDLGLVRRDLDDKRAYAAAQAGIADYSFHLNNDNSYWSRCASVPAPNAVNQQGSTANRRAVGGSSDASYAIELLPATGHSTCDPANPVATMLEQRGANTGSFRIRSTGFAGNTKQSLVATFKRASLLDYIYFTQLETSRPGHLRERRRDRRRLHPVHQVQAGGAPERGHPQLRRAVLHADLIHHRRPDQGPPAHQRRAADLRHSQLRTVRRRRDRGQCPADRLGGQLELFGQLPNFVGPSSPRLPF